MLQRLIVLLLLGSAASGLHAQWHRSGLAGRSVYSFAAGGQYLFAGSDRGVFRSSDNGAIWIQADAGMKNMMAYAVAWSDTSFFTGTYANGLFRSDNNGVSWASADTGLTAHDVLAITAGGPYLFAGTFGGGAFRSSDNAAHWTQINAGLSDTAVKSFARTGTYLFAGTNNGGVCRSSNNGDTWTPASSGLPYPTIVSLVANGTYLFAATIRGYDAAVCRSSDNGTSWVRIDSGLASPVMALAVSGKYVFAGGLAGVFMSGDFGASWARISTGLPAELITSITVNGQYLFVGVDDSGVWRRPLSELIGTQGVDNSIDGAATAFSVFPNPAGESVTVHYVLAAPADVQVSAFDALGHEVLAATERHEEAGSHDAIVNVASLLDGFYMLRLRVGTQTSYCRVIVAR